MKRGRARSATDLREATLGTARALPAMEVLVLSRRSTEVKHNQHTHQKRVCWFLYVREEHPIKLKHYVNYDIIEVAGKRRC